MNHQSIIAQRQSTIPLSLYIHFPWCLSKCPYCDFNSYALLDKGTVALYVERLLDDLASEAVEHQGSELSSIYFGGGTPSLLLPEMIAAIMQKIAKNFSYTSQIEITLEANPGTINLNTCQEFRQAGINRVSLGVQSFSADQLKKLNRIYSAEESFLAIAAIKLAGFTNFNLDLMFGLPGQNIATAIQDLQTASSFSPNHLSWYQLTLEPDLEFNCRSWQLPIAEELWKIQQAGQDLLSSLGFKQYEVAAYCREPTDSCQHNLNYWQYGDYLGIGAGAHSKITSNHYIVTRSWRVSNPSTYMQVSDMIAGREILTKEKIAPEFMLNALRLYQPLSYELFEKHTGVTIGSIHQQLQSAEKLGLITMQNNAITTTQLGKNFLNNLLEIFV